MIDSSALLLAIVMTTPAEPQETHIREEYVSINTLDGVMQRLCWPHSAALSMECNDSSVQVTSRQDEQELNLMKALNSIRNNKYPGQH